MSGANCTPIGKSGMASRKTSSLLNPSYMSGGEPDCMDDVQNISVAAAAAAKAAAQLALASRKRAASPDRGGSLEINKKIIVENFFIYLFFALL